LTSAARSMVSNLPSCPLVYLSDSPMVQLSYRVCIRICIRIRTGILYRLGIGVGVGLSRVYISATCCAATSCADEQHVAGNKQHVAGNKLLVARNMLLVRATVLLKATSNMLLVACNMLPHNMLLLRWCKRGFRVSLSFSVTV